MSVLERAERDRSNERSPRAVRKSQIYINWVNSVLGETGSHADGVESVQDGKVLCELIDILAPDAGLVNKVKASGECTPMAHISTAVEHMKSHGIKIKFPSQDILHNEVKSMLDILWLLILNYGIHYIGQNAMQRSVGNGKKRLLEWCQEELGAAFDHRNTLSFNLCNGSWFVKLLEKMAGCSMDKSTDQAEYIESLLTEIEDRYAIKKDIIKAHDIVDGTADEHTLMIYLSLLKRRMSYSDRPSRRAMFSTDGKASAMAKIHLFERRARSLSNDSTSNSPRSRSLESPGTRGRSLSSGGRSSSANSEANVNRTRSRSLYEQTIADGNETSDWSSTGSLISGKEKTSPQRVPSPLKTEENSGILHQTITERVVEQFPVTSESERDDKEAESQRVSEKETDTLSDFSSGSTAVRDKPTVQTIVPSHSAQVSSSVSESREDRINNGSRHNRQNENVRKVSNGTDSKNEAGSPSPTSRTRSRPEVPPRSKNVTNTNDQKPMESRNGGSPVDTRNRPSTPPKSIVRMEGVRSPSSAVLSDLRSVERERNLRNDAEEESFRIKIKRPKDYILQWEETMDRLSGVSMSEEPSPRPPLISNYRLEIPSRSKSFELKSTPSRTQDFASRSRSTDFTNRNIDRVQPMSNSAHSTRASGTRQMPSSIRKEVSNDPSLDGVLAQLPEDIRHQAADASKFLMQTSGPEVLALIDAIKKAREGVQTSFPREDARPPLSTSSSGSRVRFQTSPMQASQSAASPRIHSTSPYRRNGASSNEEMERGESAMLSVSPRSRSRSHSPRQAAQAKSHSDSETFVKSPERRDNSQGPSLREEMLLRSLGMNARVVEDERPSTRIMAMASSPRRISPAGMHLHHSPRKPVATEKKYPEVTRLDLGLDSDRSYASQVEDNNMDDGTPRRGGSGRIPRREAWELQKRRREANTFPSNPEDPAAQSRFIDTLCKEIDTLKVKVEMMEDEGIGSRNRSQPRRSPIAFNDRINDSSYLNPEVHEEDNELFLAKRPSMPCKFERNNSCPLLEVSSRSNFASRSSSVHDESTYVKPLAGPRSRRTYSSVSSSRSPGLAHSQSTQGQSTDGINLGYSGPSRSVTPEIWGNDLNSPEGLDPKRQEKWKRLISRRELSEGEVIELKQALACAIVEHDILKAKLNNAKHEIHDKLRHTNEVLDDCRHHLAKSQAENMELRTKCEQERQRADDLESKVKDMESTVHEVHKDNKQLEKELDHTAVMLDKSLTHTRPGVDVLREEKARLVSRLAAAEMENEKMRNDVDKLKRTQTKSMQTMDELRECLCKVRKERQELFEQLESLHRREQTAKVKQIIQNYAERGMVDDLDIEAEEFSRHQAPPRNYDNLDSDEGMFSASQASVDNIPRRSRFQDFKMDPISVRTDTTQARLLDTSFSSSPGNTPRDSSGPNEFYNDESTLSDREIYPHRKRYQPRSRSCSPLSSFRASSLPDDTFFNTSNNADNSLINQTLQDIEQDMQRERENLLFKVNSQHKLRYIPFLENENYKSPSRSSSQSKGGANVNRGSSSDRSPYSTRRIPNYPAYNSARQESADSVGRSPLHRDTPPASKRSTSMGSGRASPRQSILKSGSRPPSRSRSPSLTRTNLRDGNRSGFTTPERSASPVYFPRASHSPPTRLSPENKEKMMDQRRPRHEISKPGEIARNLQKEFDKENKLIATLSQASIFKNKSWLEVQSDSDEDTGINSSLSSFSGSERSGVGRKKTPFLTDEQRRYADELIQKYTGNAPSC